ASGTVAPDGSLVLKLYYDRDTYTVTFNTNGGNAVPSQNGIRYEGLAVTPVAPTKTGYLFDGWYSDEGLSAAYDFSSPMTDSFTLYTKWSPRTDTAYKVEHYRQNVGDDGYTLYETDDLQGTTDIAMTATAKSYPGFHENTGAPDLVASGTVAPDGSLVLKLYYDRDTYTVTFDANGGNMEPSAISVTYGHAYGTLPITTRTDYKFVGWYTTADGGVNVTSDSIVTSGGDRTLYAQWVKESCGVLDGVVNDADGNPVPGAAITIRAGNVDYKTTTADLDGRFTILAVKYGTYNLVAEKNGVTVTTILAIQAEKVSQTITLPRGKTSSVVDVLGNAPELVVGSLNTLFDRPEVYTGSDETVVAGGGTVELRMTVEEKDAATLGEDAAQITLAASGMTPLYLDVKLTKNVISGDRSEVSTTLTELPQLLDIIIPLGDTSGEGCRIFRVHNGATDEITNTPNEYGEYFEIHGSSVIVHAGRFSTYAIATPDNNSDSSQYLIKASAGSGGAVTPETAWVSDGGSVTVRIIPNEGHSIQSVMVDGHEVGAAESYTFQNVSQNHTLTATFFCPSEAYADLDTGSWYHTAVDVMISRGYMLGTAAGRWEPNGSITRAQMAMILFKMKGTDADAPTGSPFIDVSLDAWYAGPVAWAASSGVGVGYDENRFGPDDALTREQLALILYQYVGEPTGQTEDSETIFFDRSQVSPWAETAVRWAVSAGLLQGDERKLLRPQGTCTRAEAAAILYRYLTEKNERIGAGE
ncbi:MAG: InlB B-repeat-containing protein, partial [Pseudoflavonifractor sp.]|nr:InlB B-repeat-containing protein [Pseudoflavonifractor sp.]